MKRSRLAVAVLVLSAAVAAVTAASTSVAGSADVDEDLLLHFDLDGSSIDDRVVRDASSSGNHGRFVGPRSNGSMGGDGAVYFSASGGYLTVELGEGSFDGNFTVSARVKNPPQEYEAGIVTTRAWRLVADDDGYEFVPADSGATFEGGEAGRWRHLAVVHRAGTVRLYVDGALVDSSPVSDDLSARTVLIGRRPDGYQYVGWIADVRIYGRALSEATVRGLSAGEGTIRPLLYSDAFRTFSPFAVLLIAFLLALFEIGYP